MKKRKISFYEGIHPISEEERKKEIKETKLRAYLGIDIFYDDASVTKEYTPSVYKSQNEYESDKLKAECYICNNKPVPQTLQNKLVAARIELENKGLIKRYTGN